MTDATISPPAAGPALLAAIQAVNASAKFNRWAGFEVLSASPGDVELLMPWREEAGQYSGLPPHRFSCQCGKVKTAIAVMRVCSPKETGE